VLPLRALPEVHRARQDRLLQGARHDGEVGSTSGSSSTSMATRSTPPDDQGPETLGRRRGQGGRGGRHIPATIGRHSGSGRIINSKVSRCHYGSSRSCHR
jgi:hypothetical protein